MRKLFFAIVLLVIPVLSHAEVKHGKDYFDSMEAELTKQYFAQVDKSGLDKAALKEAGCSIKSEPPIDDICITVKMQIFGQHSLCCPKPKEDSK